MIRIKTYPYRRPGLGVALLAFVVWLMVATFKATVLVAKWTVVAVAAVVAVVVAGVEWLRGSP